MHLSQIMEEAILGMVYAIGIEMDSVSQSQKKKIQQVVERILDKILAQVAYLLSSVIYSILD